MWFVRLLLVEDKDSFRRLLVQALGSTPWQVRATGDPEEALRWLEADPVEVLVTDLRLPGLSGLELIRRARRLAPSMRVVLMSAFGEPRDIVEAIRLGADDFLPKPFDLDVFLALVDRLGALAGAPPPDPTEPWVALSPAMRMLDSALARAADSDVPTLFWGPGGTGRGRCARRLHTLRHPKGPYRMVDAVALTPEDLSEGALGLLQGGSLCLHRLENLSPLLVPPLLKAMDSPLAQGIRWMGTCSSPQAVADPVRLRLGVLSLQTPSLADRKEDLLVLFRALLQVEARQSGRAAPSMDRAADRQLLARDWPGELRELTWLVRRTLDSVEGVLVRNLPQDPPAAPGALRVNWPQPGLLESMLRSATREVERALLERAVREGGGELPAVAASLGLTVRALAQRLREHRIPLDDET
jgi:DNA-binding NtrC family response regulator